jgi:hypothetical protein
MWVNPRRAGTLDVVGDNEWKGQLDDVNWFRDWRTFLIGFLAGVGKGIGFSNRGKMCSEVANSKAQLAGYEDRWRKVRLSLCLLLMRVSLE